MSEPGEAPPDHLYPNDSGQDPFWLPVPQPSHPKHRELETDNITGDE